MVSEFCPRKGGDGGDSFSYHCSSEHPACLSSDILTSPSYCAILMSLLQGNSQAKVLSAYYVLQTVPVLCTFFFFGCAVSLFLPRAFSSCSGWASQCRGLSCGRTQALEQVALAVVVHRFTCPVACGIVPDQGSNPRPWHWQVDS